MHWNVKCIASMKWDRYCRSCFNLSAAIMSLFINRVRKGYTAILFSLCVVVFFPFCRPVNILTNYPLLTGGLPPPVSHLHSGVLNLSGITYGGCPHLGIFPVSCWENDENFLQSTTDISQEKDLCAGSQIKVRAIAEGIKTEAVEKKKRLYHEIMQFTIAA